jgi:DNA-binding transcriptional ArsR family regulator
LHIFATDQFHNIQAMRRDPFQALADPTRRAILLLIASGAMTPNAIAEHFDTSRQAVSKHLRILTECQLLTQQQAGREIYYHLEVAKMKEIDGWLEQFKKIWESRFNELDKVLLTIKNAKK